MYTNTAYINIHVLPESKSITLCCLAMTGFLTDVGSQ